MRVGGARPVVAFELHAAHHSRQRGRLKVHRAAGEMLEHVPRDDTSLDIGGAGKAPRFLGGAPAMRPIHDVKCQTRAGGPARPRIGGARTTATTDTTAALEAMGERADADR